MKRQVGDIVKFQADGCVGQIISVQPANDIYRAPFYTVKVVGGVNRTAYETDLQAKGVDHV